MPSASSSLMRASTPAARAPLTRAWHSPARCSSSSPRLALDAAQADRHDRHVDQHEREQHDVGGGDVLARLVQRQRRQLGEQRDHRSPARPAPDAPIVGAGVHARRGAARAGAPALGDARAPVGQPAQRAQLRAGVLGRQLVLAQRREQQRDRQQRDDERQRHRPRQVRGGCRARAGARRRSTARTAMKFSGTNAPAVIANTDA